MVVKTHRELVHLLHLLPQGESGYPMHHHKHQGGPTDGEGGDGPGVGVSQANQHLQEADEQDLDGCVDGPPEEDGEEEELLHLPGAVEEKARVGEGDDTAHAVDHEHGDEDVVEDLTVVLQVDLVAQKVGQTGGEGGGGGGRFVIGGGDVGHFRSSTQGSTLFFKKNRTATAFIVFSVSLDFWEKLTPFFDNLVMKFGI